MWQVTLYVDFHFVTVKNLSSTFRLLVKFELPPQASNKTCPNHCYSTKPRKQKQIKSLSLLKDSYGQNCAQ